MRRGPSPGWAMAKASTRVSMTGLVWFGIRGGRRVEHTTHVLHPARTGRLDQREVRRRNGRLELWLKVVGEWRRLASVASGRGARPWGRSGGSERASTAR